MPLSDPECVALLQWACPRLGLRWAGFRNVRGQVCKRLARRMAALQLASAADYRARLEGDRAEWAIFDAACRITISRFYRDRAVFELLRTRVLPDLARRARQEQRPLRLWSAGCCSGEEAYTLALIVELELLPALEGLCAELIATDADAGLLERARRGCYPSASLVELPREWVARGFVASGSQLCVRPELRAQIRWLEHDLRQPPPEGPFDLICCRNVAFTYFDPGRQRQMADSFHRLLQPGGCLVLGGHERLPPEVEGFTRVEAKLPVYARG